MQINNRIENLVIGSPVEGVGVGYTGGRTVIFTCPPRTLSIVRGIRKRKTIVALSRKRLDSTSKNRIPEVRNRLCGTRQPSLKGIIMSPSGCVRGAFPLLGTRRVGR